MRAIAYELAEELKIPHPIHKKVKKTGCDRLKYFLNQNPELSTRKSDGVSISRAKDVNKKEMYMST